MAAVAVLLSCAFCALWFRLFQLQVLQHDRFVAKARGQHFTTVPIMPRRGRVFDRNGEGIAVSVFMNSVYLDRGKIPERRREIARDLGEIFNKPPEKIMRLIELYDHPPIGRKVTLDKVALARDLMLKFELPAYAIYSVKESKRSYPNGQLAAHVLGYTRSDPWGDNQGVDGVEKYYDEVLRGNYARFKSLRDGKRWRIEPIGDEEYFSTFGSDLQLTIDGEIQRVAETELADMVDYQRADAGMLVAMDCQTGEVLALASYPAYDPNRLSSSRQFVRTNRTIAHTLETGSVMKTFLAAIMLDADLVTLDEPIDCQGGRGRFNGAPRRDAPGHVLEVVPFREVFRYSSNVGTVNVAQRADPAWYAARLRDFGFGRRTGIDLPGESAGLMASSWRPVDRDSGAIGYSVSVTPIQVATALCAIANYGLSVQPHLVREIRDCHGKLVERFEGGGGERIVSRVAAKKTLELMGEVVESGTAPKAALDGYRIGGKTGTSMKVDPSTGKYADTYIASFACVAPVDQPRLVIYCCVDEPKRDHYGGDVAAPVAREVAKVALRVMGVVPSKLSDEPPPDPELFADRIQRRQRVFGRLAQLNRDGGLLMPDLFGLTMGETSRLLARLPLEVDFQGSGLVVSQEPAPGESLDGQREARIVFDRVTGSAP